MIDVEQRALGAFEQDAFAGAPRAIEKIVGRGHERQHLRRDRRAIPRGSPRAFGGVEAEAAPQRIVMGEQAVDLGVELVGFGKVHQADRAPADLVLIGRPDAALGRADLDAGDVRGFAMRVEFAVQREDQRDIFGDLEIVRRHFDALRAQLFDLVGEMMGIEHHAIADDRQFAGPHDARRQQRQLEHLAVDDQRMAGVVAALKAHDDVGRNRQPIDDLAFSLVAPLGADHDDIGHPLRTPEPTNKTPAPATMGWAGAHCSNELRDHGG